MSGSPRIDSCSGSYPLPNDLCGSIAPRRHANEPQDLVARSLGPRVALPGTSILRALLCSTAQPSRRRWRMLAEEAPNGSDGIRS